MRTNKTRSKPVTESDDTGIRVRCTVAHEIPRGNGRFDVYVSGRIYTLSNYDPAFFVPVENQNTKKEKEVITDDSSE